MPSFCYFARRVKHQQKDNYHSVKRNERKEIRQSRSPEWRNLENGTPLILCKFNLRSSLVVEWISGEGNGTPLQYSCLENPIDGGAWWASVHGVAKSQTRLSGFTFTFHFPALEKEMATHSSILAWRIPGMGEPGGLTSMGSHRVRHDWSDLAAAEWIRICLPMQGTQVQPSLGRSHMPHAGQVKLMSHSYRSPHTLGPGSPNYWARVLQQLKHVQCSTTREAITMWNPCTATKEPPLTATRESPSTATKTQHNQK